MNGRLTRELAMWIVVAVTVVMAGVVCHGGRKEDAANVKLPPPEAAAFWTYVTTTDSYQGWSSYPGKKAGLFAGTRRGLTPARNPHGAYMKLYANEIALRAGKSAEEKPMPHGAVLVEENYDKDKKTLLSVTVMYKVKGYHPEGGDWFWAIYGPDGKATDSGKVQSCIGCHGTQKQHDWRFAGAKAKHHHY